MIPSSRKVIQVIADPGPGGAQTHVRDLVRGLIASDPAWQTAIITPPGWLANQFENDVKIIPVNFPNAWDKRVQTEISDILEQAGVGTATKPIVHFHGVRAGIAGRLAMKTRWPRKKSSSEVNGHLLGGDLPVVYTEHLWTADYHLASRLREFAQLRLLRSLDQVTGKTIAVSQAVADFLIAKRITTPGKLTVIPNGVVVPDKMNLGAGILNIGENASQSQDSRFKIQDSKVGTKVSYRIGSIGTLVPLKGYNTLIEAMPLILQNLPQTLLEIVGDGPEMGRLEQLIRRLGLMEHVRLLGSGGSSDLTKKLASWDVFVSTSHSESFGLAIAEAMAVGLPVVATRVGAVPELVTDQTGLLVPPNEPHELAKALIDLLPQSQKRISLGQAGRQRITDHFSLDAMIAKTIDLYTEILSQ